MCIPFAFCLVVQMAGKGTSKPTKRIPDANDVTSTVQGHYEVTSTLHSVPHAKPTIEAQGRAKDANQGIHLT